MAYEPIILSMGSGLRQDLARSGLEMPEGLQVCTNAVFTKRGSLRGRPAMESREADIQLVGGGSALSTWSSVITNGNRTARGVVPVQAASDVGTESPLALWDGLSLRRTSLGKWAKVGEAVPVRVSRSVALSQHTTAQAAGLNLAPVPCGDNIVASLTTNLGGKGFPIIGTDGDIAALATGTANNFDAAGENNASVAGDAIFYPTTTGDFRLHLLGTSPVSTDSLLTTGVRTDSTPRQNVSAVKAQLNAGYFVAFVSSTAGRITILRVSTAGAVQATLNVNGLGTVYGCALACDAADRLVLAWIDTAAGQLKTKAFTTTTSAITDAVLDWTSPAAPETANPRGCAFTCSSTSVGFASIVVLETNGNVRVHGRWFSAAVATSSFSLYAGNNAYQWQPLFPTTSVGSRDLVGLLRTLGGVPSAVGPGSAMSQWIVLDVTGLYASSDVTSRAVVAHGLTTHDGRIQVSSTGKPSSTSLVFGLREGATFDQYGASACQVVRVRLDLQGPAVTHGHGLSLLTSGNALIFDGALLQAHPFPESYPAIWNEVAAAGGTLAAGSYTLQATWEMVNGLGQTVRSGASLPVTVTAALNQKITCDVSVPQLVTFPNTVVRLRVRLWATDVNPSADAPLYYTSETEVSATPAAGFVSMAHSAPVDTSEVQLYTVGGVFDDEPPPAGDRGVAFAIERLWVADARRVYASLLLKQNLAPAWNTEGLHTLELPSALGEIQGMAGYDDKLVVVCSNGYAVVRGAGYDDQGNGPGWAVDSYLDVGAPARHNSVDYFVTPRGTIATPRGTVFIGKDRALWAVDSGGAATKLSGPALESQLYGDVSYLAPRLGTGFDEYNQAQEAGKLVAGIDPYLYYDLDAGMWSTWDLPGGPQYHAGVNGVLWGQTNTNIWSVDRAGTQDDPDNIDLPVTVGIQTGIIAPTGNPAGFGRIRKAALHAEVQTNGHDVSFTATADNSDVIITGTTSYGGDSPDGLWPRRITPEFYPTVQRARFLRLSLSFSSAVELIAVVLWVSGGSGSAPNNSRF